MVVAHENQTFHFVHSNITVGLKQIRINCVHIRIAMMKQVLNIFFALILFSSCQTATIDKKSTDNDLADLKSLLSKQETLLVGRKLEKKVSLDGQSEKSLITIDTAFIRTELELLYGNDIEKVFLNGGYTKIVEGMKTSFVRKASEKQGPISLDIEKENGQIIHFNIKEETNNTLFTSLITTSYVFSNDQLIKYQIDGQQDVIAKSASVFSVQGNILD